MSREDQILTICDQISTKYDKIDQIHVENVQERNFLEIKKTNAKNHTGLGWGEGDWGIGGGGVGYKGGV